MMIMISMMAVTITIFVAPSASPIGSNGTLEMYIRRYDDHHDDYDKHDDCDDNYHRSIFCISNWV